MKNTSFFFAKPHWIFQQICYGGASGLKSRDSESGRESGFRIMEEGEEMGRNFCIYCNRPPVVLSAEE